MKTYEHSPTCTGCPRCNSVFAALVQAPLREQVQFQMRKNKAEGLPAEVCGCGRCRAIMTAAAAPAAAPAVLAAPPEPPAPPSLVDAIRAKSGGAPLVDAPAYRGPGGPTVAAVRTDAVDDPPSLVDAIRNRRNSR